MNFHRKKIGRGVVRHWTPGRLRIGLAPLYGNKGLARELENAVELETAVAKSRANSSAGSLVVWYDASAIPEERIIAELDGFLNEFFGRQNANGSPHDIKDGPSSSILGKFGLHALGSVLIGCFLMYSLYRKIFRAPLSQRAFGFAGSAAIIASIPVLIEAVKKRKRKQRAELAVFLTGACCLAIFTGHALAALEIAWLFSLGTLLEKIASEKAVRKVKESLSLIPEVAFIVKDGAEIERPVDELKKDDVFAAHTGDKVAADGTVVEGDAVIDESFLNGRWEPSLRSPGDKVFAGSKIVRGKIRVRAEKTGNQTYLRHLTSLVERSLENRTESERAADSLARRLTGLGAVAAVATLIATRSAARSLSVMLVTACPCATILAASTAVAAGIANATRNRILIKDSRFLEKAAGIDVVCFGKTGTITTGIPDLADIAVRAPNQDPNGILSLAAAAEAESSHPAAKALLCAASRRRLELPDASDREEFPGRGVRAKSGEDAIFVGNYEFMVSNDVNPSYFKTKSKNFANEGKTVLYVARNGKLQGMIALENTIRPGTEEVVRRLRRLGVREIHLVSGDRAPVIANICAALEMDACRAEMLPEEKAVYVENLVSKGCLVLMAGDGVNDALAFSKADIGAAMGAGGSETALEASDIALLDGDPNGIPTLLELSAKTLKTVEANFRIAVFTNILGIILGAAGLLVPGTSGILHIAHSAAIFYNSGRLMRS